MRKTFKYRAYANKATIANTEDWMKLCCALYNVALQERIYFYRQSKKRLSYYAQQKELPEFKKVYPEYKNVNAQVLCDVLWRLDYVFDSFFSRKKLGKKAGYPRFKGRNRYSSFTLHQNGWKLDGRHLTVTNVGIFKLRLSRAIEGKIKSITLRKTPTNKWFACFSCDNVAEKVLKLTGKEVGIDVGIRPFCADSEGGKIENQKFFDRENEILRIRLRRMCRRQRHSNNREAARLLVSKSHEQIRNRRLDFLYKIAKEYIEKYDTIYIENLNISNMVQNNHASLKIYDGAWGKFFMILERKAEEAGRQIIKVSPWGTSQNCSQCGEKVEKRWSNKVHSCPYCGLVLDRDINAARNILRVGQNLQPLTCEVAQCVG